MTTTPTDSRRSAYAIAWPGTSNRSDQTEGRSPRVMPLMRKVEIVHLVDPDTLEFAESTRLVPAHPAFDEAFATFARDTLLSTDRGQVAVEDLLPGDRVKTVDDGFQTLLWRGATVVSSQATGQDPSMGRLTRISADALGIARPMPDLILGPRARLVHRAPGITALTGRDRALIPARDFVDGVQIVDLTPPTTVQVFNLGFAQHHLLTANGVEVGSLHPGPTHLLNLRGDLLALYLSCFPHIRILDDFGPGHLPLLRREDLNLFDVA